jgi:hypothetical protein
MIASVRSIRRILVLALALTAVSVAAAQAGAVRYLVDSLSRPTTLGTDIVIDFNPSMLLSQAELPNSIALFLPAHWRFDRRGVAGECTPVQAAASGCPANSRMGYGHAVVHITGYLFPGGETDAVAYITPYLGQPVQAGDKASIVLQIQILGLAPVVDAVRQETGITLRTTYSVIGRLIPLHAGLYGLEASFSGFPGGISVPPALQARGLSVSMTRFKLLFGSVRRVTKRIYLIQKIPTLTGGTTTLKIPDRKQVPYHLLAKSKICPADNQWPYEIQVGFPGQAQSITGGMTCKLPGR